MLFRSPHLCVLGLGLAALGLGAVGARAVTPLSTERVSVSTSEFEGFGDSFGPVELSADGRFVVFTSTSDDFYAQDGANSDVFLRDRTRGVTELISIAQPVVPGPYVISNGNSRNGSVSGDGRFVVYESDATNLVVGDGNNFADIFMRDRFGAITRISVAPDGASANGASRNPRISRSGRFIAFESAATNIVGGDDNAVTDVFVRDLILRVTRRVSTNGMGAQANGASSNATISGNGRFVAFQSAATNLAGGAGTSTHAYVKDTFTGGIQLASQADDGTPGDDDSTLPTISADGRSVAFVSVAGNLASQDTNGFADVYLRNLFTDTTTLVSIASDGSLGDGDSGASITIGGTAGRPGLSGDGRYVAFTSEATNFDLTDDNAQGDVFLYDTSDLTIARVSVGGGLVQGDGPSVSATVSEDGTAVGYSSTAGNLVLGDFNFSEDVFVTTVSGTGGGNNPPIADAGFDLSVNEGDLAFLDGSNSTDPDGDSLTYQWTQLFSGDLNADADDPIIVLDNSDTEFPSFTAPFVFQDEVVVFELAVSDGINIAIRDRVEVEITALLAQSLSGSVTDGSGNPIENATVRLVRDLDGAEVEAVQTDPQGVYFLQNTRVGDSTLFVSAPGYETVATNITIVAGEDAVQDVTLSESTAVLRGTILLARGQSVPGAIIRLLDDDGSILAEDTTDAAGEYRLGDLDLFEIGNATTLTITRSNSDTPWTVSNLNLQRSSDNVRDFQYGNLVVTIKAASGVSIKQLNGTVVEVLIGDRVLATNSVTSRTRTFTFRNVPATLLRVKAYSRNRLSGQQVEASVSAGATPRRVTLTMRKRNVF